MEHVYDLCQGMPSGIPRAALEGAPFGAGNGAVPAPKGAPNVEELRHR